MARLVAQHAAEKKALEDKNAKLLERVKRREGQLEQMIASNKVRRAAISELLADL